MIPGNEGCWPGDISEFIKKEIVICFYFTRIYMLR